MHACLKAKLFALSLLLLASPSYATIRYVNDAQPNNNGDGLSWATAFKDLNLAISVAQAGDEIWVAQGTYKPTTNPAQTAASFSMKEGVAIYGGFTSGQANRNDRNPDPTTNNTTLSGDINNDGLPTGNSRNVVYNAFTLTKAAILDGFTITHGNSNAAYGGGMYNENSSPKIANCRFIGNSAQTGGGMYNISTTGNACSPTLVNCTFQNNSASFGGGMYNNARTGTSSPTLTNCAFITNTSASGGGAMYNDASSNMGGNSSPVLTNCRFSGNATTSTNTFGGAVYNIVNAANGTSDPVFINCSFQGNTSTGFGAAVFNFGGQSGVSSPTFTNCSFQGNSSSSNNGTLVNYSIAGSRSVPLINCVFFDNGGSNTIRNLVGGTATASYSLFESSVTGYLDGGSNQTTSVNPFVSTTGTELRTGSPAIDAGNNAANSTCTDLAGNVRKLNTIDLGAYEFGAALPYSATLGGTATISAGGAANLSVALGGGAAPYTVTYVPNGGSNTPVSGYTSGATIPVGPNATTTYRLVSVTDASGCAATLTGTPPGGSATITIQTGPQTRYVNASRPDDSGDGLSWATAHKYLQTALAAAQSGDQIWVAQGIYKPTTSTTDRGASFVMKENVKIYGGFTSGQTNLSDRNTNPATNGTVLSGDINNDNLPAGNSLHVVFNNDNGLTSAALLDGFTIRQGNADGTLVNGAGGGIFNSNSSPQIINCAFRENAASIGGAIYNWDGSTPQIINCTFRQNAATFRGGAIANNNSAPQINGCDFQENVTTYDGGAVYNTNSIFSIVNCSFLLNDADVGGGVYNGDNSNVELINCLFLNNTAAFGGALGNDLSTPRYVNCTFQGNSATINSATIRNNQTTINSEFVNCILWNSGPGNDSFIFRYSTFSYCVLDASAFQTFGDGGNNILVTESPFVSANSTELRACSPAIDAGKDAANNTTTDLAGNARKIRTIDIGAYEYQGTLPVITATLGGGGSICGVGSASLSVNITGGTGPYTLVYATNGDAQTTLTDYVSNSAIQVSPIQTTTYSLVSISDANGCTASTLSSSVNVTVTPGPTATVSGGGTACTGATAPSVIITLTGGAPYSITYSDGANSTTVNNITNNFYYITSPAAGTYTVTAVSNANCSGMASGSANVTITPRPDAPTISANPGNTTTNQPIIITASGCEGGTISWMASGGTGVADGNQYTISQPGSYTIGAKCTINGCISNFSNTLNPVISPCPTISATFNGTTAICNGANTGLNVSLTGGTAPYTVVYTDGSSNQTLSSYVSGTSFTVSPATTTNYTLVSVTDANGCTATLNTESRSTTVTVNPVPNAPTLSADPGTTTTNSPIIVWAAGCSGTISWNTSGGVDNGNSTYTFTNAGSYSISATCTLDGCTSPASQVLNVSIGSCILALDQPTVTDLSCFNSSDGSIVLTATGGTGTLNFTLNPGNVQNTTGNFTGLSAGTYTVGVTDATNCTATSGSISITQPTAVPAPSLSANPGNTTTNQPIVVTASGCSGTVAWTPTGGTGTSNGNQYTFSQPGSYMLSATCTVDGCTSPESQPLSLTIESCPTIALTTSGNKSIVLGSGSNCTELSANASGGTGPYIYNWTSNATPPASLTGPVINVCPEATTTYTVTVTDANGCTSNPQEVTVTVNDVRCGNKNQNVTICYYGVTQCVSDKIADRYLKLGATLGACGSGTNTRIGVPETTDAPLQLSLKALPNPVHDATTLEVLSPNAGIATFELIDVTGLKRRTYHENLVEGTNKIELNLGHLSSGIYLIKVVDAKNRPAAVRIIKN
ncbi:choice-of-anchor Q domain-containing protein [Persicitalea jodogahamensis]|uniref:Secretion system C-terminal sorting domain-containing protein n=1 Tax=Persicitalea jodogahamensis TaxID=402147 RepID=A0A8J3D0J8_9BACT|nr:choice-of-anchor Q domain-containing protein [Persicitalea jodogahamensis]GHB58263.1 hypothetical protein GCM10007390_09690 [Persicitalea jodogahamensis]